MIIRPSVLTFLHVRQTARKLSTHTTTTTTKHQPVITVIGGGNMAEALLGGLQTKQYKQLRYVEAIHERLQYMRKEYPGMTGLSADPKDQDEALQDANVVVLAVKPHQLREALPSIVHSPSLSKSSPPLFVSIVGGVTISQMIQWMALNNKDDSVGRLPPVVRCMPNTPAFLGEGAFGLYANASVNQDQRELTDQIMQAVAKKTLWVEKEALIDTVTGVSGSGPAYFFLLMEALQNAGMEAGLTKEASKTLTIQTCLGAARMAQQEGEDLASLRKKVTSPKGTTEAAIKTMEDNQVRKLMKDAVFAATQRARELSDELDIE
ncbi:pyrroline-5-carboxylate reductase dimerization-domain-containing protein [Absidia repens]|uniref:Pyrroline-5-carboxylate reductase n=1 Tax=Absidia repens TaxID=90262 RepID=A0A1X2I6A2_9FUNG|nr:pyrroline-5-carboxylate reductase dimerization-domain-containing protein [Absidia repens]